MAPLSVRPSVVIPDTELSWRFSRSSGPGGQHVNTSDSAAELSFDLASSPSIPEPLRDRAVQRLAHRLNNGVISIRASNERSQWRNRQAALDRLSALLYEATAPLPRRRRPTKPSRGVHERRLQAKRMRSETKRMRSRPID